MRESSQSKKGLEYVERRVGNSSSEGCNYLPMSVGWQPDVIALHEEVRYYDRTLATLETRIREMAKVMAQVAAKTGIPHEAFMVQQGIDHLWQRDQDRRIKRGKNDEFKQQVLEKYREAEKEGIPLTRFCILHNLPQRTLRRWVTNK